MMEPAMECRLLKADETDKLVALVRACYGDSYPYDLLYDRELLAQKLACGELVSAVAIDERGDLVGHVATAWQSSDARSGDVMSGMILEQYQRRALLGELSKIMWQGFYPAREFCGMQLYAVTTHTISQQRGLDSGTVCTGFLLADWPGQVCAAGIDARVKVERYPMVPMYRPLWPAPERCSYVPCQYRAFVESIYQQANYSRELYSQPQLAASGCTVFEHSYDLRRQLGQLQLAHIGGDYREVLQVFIDRAAASAEQCWYIDVPLQQASAIELLQYLAEKGWFFGALLIERLGGDFLRMQYSCCELNSEALVLAEGCREAMKFVIDDRNNNLADTRS